MFFKKETPADKVRKEIESTEFKKQSMISIIESEKNTLSNEKWKELCNMGVYAYEQCENENPEYDFSNFVEAIKILEKEITEKDKKIEEISVRYDEEIDLLNKSLQALTPAPPQPIPAPPQPMQAPVPQPMPVPMPQPMPAPDAGATLQNQDVSMQASSFCNQCGKGLETGDAFCPFCGNKV